MKIHVVAFLFILLCLCACTNKRPDTEAQCRMIADRLDGQLLQNGLYDRQPLNEVDGWGRQIHLEYSDPTAVEMLTVRSAGYDGIFGSRDDIVVQRQNLVASEVGEGIGEGLRGVIRGLMEPLGNQD